MFRIPSPRRAAVVGVLGMALLAAACGGNDAGSTGNQAAAPPTTACLTASGPFGPACSAVPASGAGSLEALAQDPVATAASTPRAVHPGHRGHQGRPGRHPEQRPGHHRVRPTNDAFARGAASPPWTRPGDPKGPRPPCSPTTWSQASSPLTSSPAATRPSRAHHPGHRERPGLHHQRQLRRGLRQHPDRQRHRLPHRPGPPPHELTTQHPARRGHRHHRAVAAPLVLSHTERRPATSAWISTPGHSLRMEAASGCRCRQARAGPTCPPQRVRRNGCSPRLPGPG